MGCETIHPTICARDAAPGAQGPSRLGRAGAELVIPPMACDFRLVSPVALQGGIRAADVQVMSSCSLPVRIGVDLCPNGFTSRVQ